MDIALIVAVANKGVIGADNQLPWRLPEDLRYFKQKTLGKPVIMGRKTYQSIGRPLPGRANIVVTRQPHWSAHPDLRVAGGLEEAIALAAEAMPEATEAMVMGGAEIYRQALPLAQRIYLTRVELEVPGDAHFPPLAPENWRQVSCVLGEGSAPLKHRFLVFERAC